MAVAIGSEDGRDDEVTLSREAEANLVVASAGLTVLNARIRSFRFSIAIRIWSMFGVAAVGMDGISIVFEMHWENGSAISAQSEKACPQNERHDSIRLASSGRHSPINGKWAFSIWRPLSKTMGTAECHRSM